MIWSNPRKELDQSNLEKELRFDLIWIKSSKRFEDLIWFDFKFYAGVESWFELFWKRVVNTLQSGLHDIIWHNFIVIHNHVQF